MEGKEQKKQMKERKKEQKIVTQNFELMDFFPNVALCRI